jgi:hypothetical protein
MHPVAPHSTFDLNRWLEHCIHAATNPAPVRKQFLALHPVLQQHGIDRLKELANSATTRTDDQRAAACVLAWLTTK